MKQAASSLSLAGPPREEQLRALTEQIHKAIADAKWNLGEPLPEWSVTETVSFIRVDEGNGHVCHISNHHSGQRGPRTGNFIANSPNLIRLLESALSLLAAVPSSAGGKEDFVEALRVPVEFWRSYFKSHSGPHWSVNDEFWRQWLDAYGHLIPESK